MLTFDPVRHASQNTLDFKPPLPNPWLQQLFYALLPTMFRKLFGGLSLDISQESLNKLRAIQGERCLILPNHPSEWDPCVIFEVARQLKENFFFVAAREVFDYSYGLRGWFFQHLGVYSLVRGSNDRKSLKTSIDILSGNRGRLVIFIEGEISNQNETIMPLEAGVVQLAFMALNELYKSNGKSVDALPSLYVCPTSIKYNYCKDGLDESIHAALKQLEHAIGLQHENGASHYERIKAIAAKVLAQAAAQFGYPLNPESTLAIQVTGLSCFMLGKLEHVLNLPAEESLSTLDRIRRIRNKMDKVLSHQDDEAQITEYQKRLHHHQKAVLKNCYEDLDRAVNFIAVYEGYLQPGMEDARYVEMIRRLEREVFGTFRLVHPRAAQVIVHDPIDLKTYFPAFLADKHGTATQIADQVEQCLLQGVKGESLITAK
jgi:1-acyl-sn-glycerol-3-phosphate acyltransferase